MNHPIPFSRSVLSLSLVTLLSVSGSAWSISASNSGARAIDGARGTRDNFNGGDGTAGGDINVSVITDDSSHVVIATGAEGGRGGRGISSALRVGNGGNAGNGGSANAVAGQLASDSIRVGNASVRVTAQGGKGGLAGYGANAGDGRIGESGAGANGGNADASASVVVTGDVRVEATSIAGNGSGVNRDPIIAPVFIGNGGNANLGRVYGESTEGGRVVVVGTAQGGNGGGASRTGDLRNTSKAGNGAGVFLINAVNGETSGYLGLTQNATGGSAGAASSGDNGAVGFARSALVKTISSNVLSLTTTATGGTAAMRFDGGTILKGGLGQAVAIGTNNQGAVKISTTALGGNVGGDALSYALGRKTTDNGFNVELDSRATGGRGNDEFQNIKAGDGGNATSVAIGFATGSSQVSGISIATGGFGGNSVRAKGTGGNGGSANASVKRDIKNLKNEGRDVFLQAIARGGTGGAGSGIGESGGSGGRAVGSAEINSTINGSVEKSKSSVSVEQFGGNGGDGFDGADGGNGADSIMKNAFNLSSTDQLFLSQKTTGGKGGRSEGGIAGKAGNASSTLEMIGEYNRTTVNAIGGQGGEGSNGSDAASGGNATAGVVSLISRDTLIKANVGAEGGKGGSVIDGSGNAGNGGRAKLSRVYAESLTGGDINVTGGVGGGSGGDVNGAGKAGNGFSMSLINAVDGKTNGNLYLTQKALGGASGNVLNGINGLAGDAVSILTRVVSSASLRLIAGAFGGNGGSRQSVNGSAANGGSARVVVNGVNATGRINIGADVFGGNGGNATEGSDAGFGGRANAIAVGSVFAEDVSVGGTAKAGNGGNNNISNAGSGGNANSSSKAVDINGVTGSNKITVGDIAIGGQAGLIKGTAIGASGGNAFSRAEATGGAFSTVSSTSTGGTGSGNKSNGTGRSFAVATGINGISTANANSGIETNRNYAGAIAKSALAGSSANTTLAVSRSRAISAMGKTLPLTQVNDLQAAAYATLLPNADDVTTLIVGNTTVEASFLDKEVLVAGFLRGNFSENGTATIGQLYSSSVDFNIDMDSKANSNLSVGLFDSITKGDHGFDSLLFKITIEDVEVENMLFSDVATAEIYFNDNALNFGLWGDLISADNVLDLKFSLDLTEQHAGQGFSTNLIAGAGAINNLTVAPRLAAATVVPVPAAVWLFGSGLLGLLTISRRRK